MEKAGQTAKIIWPVAACAGNAQLADKMPLIFRSFSQSRRVPEHFPEKW
jgi:hypothetical protein